MCEDASEGGRSAQDDASIQARCGRSVDNIFCYTFSDAPVLVIHRLTPILFFSSSPVSELEFRRQLERQTDGPITRGMLKRAIDEVKHPGSGRHLAVERTEADVGDLANHLARSAPPKRGRRGAVEDIDMELVVHELDYDESQLWGRGRRRGRKKQRKQTGNYQSVASFPSGGTATNAGDYSRAGTMCFPSINVVPPSGDVSDAQNDDVGVIDHHGDGQNSSLRDPSLCSTWDTSSNSSRRPSTAGSSSSTGLPSARTNREDEEPTDLLQVQQSRRNSSSASSSKSKR